MKGYPGGFKTARWLKAHKSRKCRHRINQIVKVYCKDKRYKQAPGLDELHLPQMNDIYDPWCWD